LTPFNVLKIPLLVFKTKKRAQFQTSSDEGTAMPVRKKRVECAHAGATTSSALPDKNWLFYIGSSAVAAEKTFIVSLFYIAKFPVKGLFQL
jgi:hypothetical protein